MSDPIHPLASLQSPVFLVNSRHPLFTATPASFRSKSLHRPEHTFSRSYGVILPSSLTRVISSALGFSPRPPESVCGTVTRQIHYEAFLGSVGSTSLFPLRGSSSRLGVMSPRICLWTPPTRLNRDFRHPDGLPSCVPPSLKRFPGGTGILTCFPSATPFGLTLGTD